MALEDEKGLCEVCAERLATTIPTDIDGVHQDCPRCGEFKFARTASTGIRSGVGKERRARLSGWVREQNRSGSTPLITTNNIDKILACPIPSYAERASALLIEAERGLKSLGDSFNIGEPRFLAATYSSDQQDINYLLRMLKEQGFVEERALRGECQILPRGYMQLDEIRKRGGLPRRDL